MSTPMSAYRWCREQGLSHEVSVKLTASRSLFEYFVRCL